jgi:phage shock protein PspC (stress-responsive transcriptional regulator)
MHEIRKIHLGRQAFTIAADAYKELQDYLHAIEDQVEDPEVVHEVESRMAELLSERGISQDKVVLTSDITFLRDQLGKPEDFTEEADQPTGKSAAATPTKRFFRDTENAMVAGVSAGLAQYFGIDPLIIRLLFILGAFAGGWGIILYLILWLLVPEAKTPSERLQMAGKPITVNSLKEVVVRADVASAAKRANSVAARVINTTFYVVLKIVGVSLVLFGLFVLLAIFTAGGYLLVHTGSLFGQDIFPIGVKEHILTYSIGAGMALMSLFVIILGIAAFKRKWPVSSWVLGALVGLLLISMAGSMALGADVAPQVHDRYQSHIHSSTRTLQPFTTIDTIGSNISIDFSQSSTYSVKLTYFDNPDLRNIKTTVTNGVLTIDASAFDQHRHCQAICIPDTYNVTATIYAPNPDGITAMPWDAPVDVR